jgi:hypothetical protein
MAYEQIEYQVRASLGRNEWVILIYYPDKADGKATVSKFVGTKEEAAGAARRKSTNRNGERYCLSGLHRRWDDHAVPRSEHDRSFAQAHRTNR